MLERWRRILRHRWMDERAARQALPAQARQSLAQAVSAGELRHTGQVRVMVEAGLPWSYLWRGAPARERAVMQFGKLRVWDTEHNNGVLVYLLLAERRIEIVADRALARLVPQARWDALVRGLAGDLQAGRFTEGLLQAIQAIHDLLAEHFPGSAGAPGPNELPDDPVVL